MADGASDAGATDDRALVAALQAGDEAAFQTLIERYHPALVRLAMAYVSDRAVAEDVAQETWIGVLRGINRFEARSSLKTWIFRILVNQARRRGKREARSLPFSALARSGADADEASVDADRFLPPGDEWAGHWAVSPQPWHDVPETRLLQGETRAVLDAAIAELPPTQRAVITLRDVEGLDAAETCALLGLTEGNQRVLLHRARAKVRTALEPYLAAG